MTKLLAVAQLTFRGALRTRAFWAVAVLVLLVGLLLPPSLRDDGTACGRAMLVLSYGLGVSQALLCLAAGWLGAETICRDLSRRHIVLLATKPLPRWQIWLGRWLGLVALNAVLLLLAAGLLWAQLQMVARSRRWTVPQRREAWFLVLTARAERRPATIDFDREAGRRLTELIDRREVPANADRDELRRNLRREIVAFWQSVPPGKSRTWEFRGVYPPRGARSLTLRFRFRPAGALPSAGAKGEFQVGQTKLSGPFLPDRFWHLEVPVSAIQPGTVTVRFENKSPFTLAFPLPDGPTLLYVNGGFNSNYLRAVLILGLQLAFMSALGLSAGSLFSFPVAAFVVLSYLAVAAQVPLLSGQLEQGTLLTGHHGSLVAPWLERTVQAVVSFAWQLGGALHRFQPISQLSDGLHIPWSQVRSAFWVVGLFYSAIAAAPGLAYWTRREMDAGGDA